MTTRRLAAFLAAVVVGVAGFGLGACGGDDDEQAAPPPAATEPYGEAPAGGKIDVAADPGGQLKFVQSSLAASAGSQAFEFTNDAAVGHDFVIEQDGKKVAGTKVITEATASLTTNLEAGEYTYYCSVAGHRAAGMEGTLTVK